MRYLICIVTDGGDIHTLAKDHDFERAKQLANKLQAETASQVKILERTEFGFRIAYTCTLPTH